MIPPNLCMKLYCCDLTEEWHTDHRTCFRPGRQTSGCPLYLALCFPAALPSTRPPGTLGYGGTPRAWEQGGLYKDPLGMSRQQQFPQGGQVPRRRGGKSDYFYFGDIRDSLSHSPDHITVPGINFKTTFLSLCRAHGIHSFSQPGFLL